MREKKRKTKRSFATRLGALLLAAVLACGVLGSTSAQAASTNVIRHNISTSKVSGNATDKSLPTSASSVDAGSYYYFNLQVSSDLKMKKAVLYVKLPGASDYTKVHTETATNYMRYVYYKYKIPSDTASGTMKYKWQITFTDGTKKTTSVQSITVNSSIVAKWNKFKSDSRWKNGITWKSSQTPKLSSYSSKGCAAYCADVVKYVYGKSSPRSGTKFTSISKIQAGDVLVMKSTGGTTHWIYVYGRSGNKLYTAEGNASGKVKISTSRYTISGSYIVCGSTKYKLTAGYHYQ